MISSTPSWTGMVPVDDTALAVTDSGGSGTPVIYLNGQFATQGYWRRVIAELGPGWRYITYDERARGRKSGRSADYSFQAAVRDVDAVLEARGVDRALVVGWSYGAFVAANWASRKTDRTIGAVLVDGAQPHDWLTNEMEQGIQSAFRSLQWLMVPLRLTGLTPRMTALEMASCNIEVGKLARERELGPVDGQDHRPDPVCPRIRNVVRQQGGRAGEDPRQRACGGRTQPAHHDLRQSCEQSRRDPPQGLPRYRRGGPRRRRLRPSGAHAHNKPTDSMPGDRGNSPAPSPDRSAR